MLTKYFLAAILALGLCGICNSAVIDRTIAKINDDILTESDLAEITADAAGQFKAKGKNAFASATSETVMSMLDRALLLQEAKRLKITPTNDEMNIQVEGMVREIRANFQSEKEFHQALAQEHISLDQLKEELVKKSKTDFMVYHVISSRYSVSDKDVEAFQQKQAGKEASVSSYRLRRLGIAVTKTGGAGEASRKAREVVAKIIQDGISFEEGIRKYSQVPGADQDGGDMGYLSSDKLNSEVRSAVENLSTGQASKPIVAGGFANIFYLEGKRGAKSAAREAKFFEAREELLRELRRKSILQVYDERLRALLPQEYARAQSSFSSGANAVKPSVSPSSAAAAAITSSSPKTQPAPGNQMLLSPPGGLPPKPVTGEMAPAPAVATPEATPQPRKFPRLFGGQS